MLRPHRETGGVRVNIVPKDGGNRFSGQMFANYADEKFQSTNMTDELRATGLRDPDTTKSLWTVNPSIGGPIVRDRLWFYGGYARMVNERLKAGTYFNTDLAGWRPSFDTATPYLAQYKFGGSYELPFGIQLSATLQSFRGGPIQANATFTNAQIAPSLGRSLSAGSTASVTLLEPNTLYNERVSQLDLRFAKNFRLRGYRIKGMLDMFNATNNNTITNVNNSYGTTGASWRVPTAISLARLFKVGAQVDF